MPDVVCLDLVRNRWAGTDERHVPSQDVEELGQLVETGLPEQTPDARQPWIFGDLVDLVGAVSVPGPFRTPLDELLDVVHVDPGVVPGVHGPKLEARERNSVLADPFLTVENWAR